MLTYQLQPRVLKKVTKATFNFPSVVTIELKLAPPTTFGTKDDLSRTSRSLLRLILLKSSILPALYSSSYSYREKTLQNPLFSMRILQKYILFKLALLSQK